MTEQELVAKLEGLSPLITKAMQTFMADDTLRIEHLDEFTTVIGELFPELEEALWGSVVALEAAKYGFCLGALAGAVPSMRLAMETAIALLEPAQAAIEKGREAFRQRMAEIKEKGYEEPGTGEAVPQEEVARGEEEARAGSAESDGEEVRGDPQPAQ